MGFKDQGFIDCDQSDPFLSIPADADFEIARMQAIERILEGTTLAADQERASTGPNIEVLSNQPPEKAKRLHHMVEI